MDAPDREFFDRQLEVVLPDLPARIHELLHVVPLIVEDHPSRELRRLLGLRRKDTLCGLYTGVPLIRRSLEQSGTLSDVIHLFRMGLLAAARDADGQLDADKLRQEIRVTILHELGHYHGMSECELEDLGY
jgi:predicted Zn-dependent protease with MMP-like domain